jgi:hypothetical protein
MNTYRAAKAVDAFWLGLVVGLLLGGTAGLLLGGLG